MRRAFSFFIGVLLGGLVGATLSLLFAPSSGVEMRAKIGSQARTLATEVRQAANTKRIELQDRLETLRAPRAQ